MGIRRRATAQLLRTRDGAIDERRRLETLTLVGSDLTEAASGLPVFARGYNLFGGPRHEVPPHQDRLAKWRAAQEQCPRRIALAGEQQLPASAAQVIEGVDRERLAVEPARSLQRHEGVFVLGVQAEGEPAKGYSRHIRGDQGREGTRGRTHAVQMAHDERRDATLQLDDRK